MCGLCGVLSPELSQDDIEAFRHLMILSTLRGQCGSGVAVVHKKIGKPIDIVKHETLSAAELVYGAEFANAKKGKTTCLMGHARAPTAGGITLDDTHPHVVQDIIGTHNGTMAWVNNHLVQKKDNDSLMLFKTIANQGIDQTVQKSEGPFALAYINKKTDEVCFVRNEGRSLAFAVLTGKPDTLFWASESGFLRLVLRRRFPLEEIKIFNPKPFEFITFRAHPTQNLGYVNRRMLQGPKTETPATTTTTTTTTTSVPAVGGGTGSDSYETMYETKRGHFLSGEDLMACLQAGCSNCNMGQAMQRYMQKEIHWIDKTEFICDWCASTDDTAREYLRSVGGTLPSKLVIAH